MRMKQRGHSVVTSKVSCLATVLMLSGALLGACGTEPATPNVGVTDATVEAIIPEAEAGAPLTTPLAGIPLATPVPEAATSMPTSATSTQEPVIIDRSAGPQGQERLTINDIPDDPSALVGQTLNVRGQLANVIGSRAFVLRDLPTLGNDQLLIIAANDQVIPNEPIFAQGGGSQAAQNQNIVVSGTLRLFNLGAIEDEIGADLQDAQFSQYAGQPVMIARKVEVVSNQLDTNP